LKQNAFTKLHSKVVYRNHWISFENYGCKVTLFPSKSLFLRIPDSFLIQRLHNIETMNDRQPPRYTDDNHGQPPHYNNPNNYNQGPLYQSWYSNEVFASSPVTGKCRGVAALLAIFLGSLGIHYFYLGKNNGGLAFLLISVLSCGILGTITGIVSIIQAIRMLIITNEEFDRDYVLTLSTFPF